MGLERYESIFDLHYSDFENIDFVLQKMREAGASQLNSVVVIRGKLDLSLKEADPLVLHSIVWEDHLDENLSYRKQMQPFKEELMNMFSDDSDS